MSAASESLPQCMRLAAVAFVCALALACSRPITQFTVAIDSNFCAGEEVDALELRTLDESGQIIATNTVRLGRGPGMRRFPGSFGIVRQSGARTNQMRLEIDVKRGDCVLFTHKVQSTFVADQNAQLNVYLARECALVAPQCGPRANSCTSSETCGRDGVCQPIEQVPGPLQSSDAATPDGSDGERSTGPSVRQAITSGAAIAVSYDDRVTIAVNRTVGSVSVFHTSNLPSHPVFTLRAEIAMPSDDGPNAEPWAAVIGNDDRTAYVVLRRARRLVRIDNLLDSPSLAPEFANTGSEPTGVAISPSGRRLYVTNWGEGTITVVDAATMRVADTIDLNCTLAHRGHLGPLGGRPGIAHPRAIVITNNRNDDDSDESALVTEFFGQVIPETERILDPPRLLADLETGSPPYFRADVERQGLVYRVSLATHAVTTIPIAPVADTGFPDRNGDTTGCYPNQLYAAAISPGEERLYVTSVCASPRGPLGPCTVGEGCSAEQSVANFRTVTHSVIFVVALTGTRAFTELPQERVLLNRRFATLFDTPSTLAQRLRVPLIPLSLAFVPSYGQYLLYAPAYGSDAVFRIHFDAEGTAVEVGEPQARYIDLAAQDGVENQAHLPIGIAILYPLAGAPRLVDWALVQNANSRNLSVVYLGEQTLEATVSSVRSDRTGLPPLPDPGVNSGRRSFVTGTGRWSHEGASWGSCEACHPDGLSDGVTWFFTRGPRQTIGLDGTFGPQPLLQQRILNWTGIFDEIQDFDSATRTINGGTGAIVSVDPSPRPPQWSDRVIYNAPSEPTSGVRTAKPHDGLNGSTESISSPSGSGVLAERSVIDDLDRLREYIQTIRSPRAPVGLSAADIEAGRSLFTSSHCHVCHGGPSWTISRRFYQPSVATNTSLLEQTYVVPPRSNGQASPLEQLNLPIEMTGQRTLRYPPTNSDDQIRCVLRHVRTFGIGPVGGRHPMLEARQDMAPGRAQGAEGYNPPSLSGLSASAPFFHSGNARTLEELFTSAFAPHYKALAANFLGTVTERVTVPGDVRQIRQLIAFLLSIDDRSAPVQPTMGITYPADLCPVTFP